MLERRYFAHFLSSSDEEVVKTGETPEMLILNETESHGFKCKVVRPIIDAQVYLEIIMKGWPSPSRFFTGGRKLPDNQPRPDSNISLSWTEEYEFEVELSVEMYGIQCLGMDVYNNGTWRKNWRRIQFVYGVPPAVRKQLSRDYGHLVFTVGEGARLDCPIYYGVPEAKFTWYLPSGKQQETEDNTLYIKTVSPSDWGQITCVAENKYGSAFLGESQKEMAKISGVLEANVVSIGLRTACRVEGRALLQHNVDEWINYLFLFVAWTQ